MPIDQGTRGTILCLDDNLLRLVANYLGDHSLRNLRLVGKWVEKRLGPQVFRENLWRLAGFSRCCARGDADGMFYFLHKYQGTTLLRPSPENLGSIGRTGRTDILDLVSPYAQTCENLEWAYLLSGIVDCDIDATVLWTLDHPTLGPLMAPRKHLLFVTGVLSTGDDPLWRGMMERHRASFRDSVVCTSVKHGRRDEVLHAISDNANYTQNYGRTRDWCKIAGLCLEAGMRDIVRNIASKGLIDHIDIFRLAIEKRDVSVVELADGSSPPDPDIDRLMEIFWLSLAVPCLRNLLVAKRGDVLRRSFEQDTTREPTRVPFGTIQPEWLLWYIGEFGVGPYLEQALSPSVSLNLRDMEVAAYAEVYDSLAQSQPLLSWLRAMQDYSRRPDLVDWWCQHRGAITVDEVLLAMNQSQTETPSPVVAKGLVDNRNRLPGLCPECLIRGSGRASLYGSVSTDDLQLILEAAEHPSGQQQQQHLCAKCQGFTDRGILHAASHVIYGFGQSTRADMVLWWLERTQRDPALAASCLARSLAMHTTSTIAKAILDRNLIRYDHLQGILMESAADGLSNYKFIIEHGDRHVLRKLGRMALSGNRIDILCAIHEIRGLDVACPSLMLEACQSRSHDVVLWLAEHDCAMDLVECCAKAKCDKQREWLCMVDSLRASACRLRRNHPTIKPT
ncbi:hypothetical protein [Mollivirus kamchatka]|nr:hypothetical protein [Mollivirus kamchatka]